MATRTEKQKLLVEGGTLSGLVIMAVVLFAMVNYLSARHYQRFDATASKIYSLSKKSEQVLENLDRPIELLIFFSNPSGELFPAADEILSRYEAFNSELITKRTIDPARNLLEAQQLAEKHSIGQSNAIVVVSGDDSRVIPEFDLAEYDYSGAQFGQPPTLKSFKGEQLVTSAILELIEAKKPKILFTSGHGEAALDNPGDPSSLAAAKDLLGQDNFILEEWVSATATEVPADTDLVVIAGPQTPFFEPELEMISSYLETGGRLLVLLDPVLEEANASLKDIGLGPWLNRYGIDAGNNVVIDPTTQLMFFGPETVFTDSFGFHPIVEDLEQTRSRVLFRMARSVGRGNDVPEGYDVTELVKASDEAWGETDLSDLENLQADASEVQGGISLGVSVAFKIASANEIFEDATDETTDAEVELFEPADEDAASEETDAEAEPEEEPEARLVVFGDLDFAANAQISQGANAALVLNSFNWLVQREQLISIEGRTPDQTQLNLARGEISMIYLLVLLLLPGLAVAAGVMTYLSRRR